MPEHPLARSQDLIVETIGDELLVFDTTTNRAHSLNATAAAVWNACDGTRTRQQIAEHCQLDPLAVELALHDLADAKLLADYTPPAERVSRRTAIRRLALTGATLGIALPAIRSIVAPSSAMATSTAKNQPNGEQCYFFGFPGSYAVCSPGSVCHPAYGFAGSSFCGRSPGASCFPHSSFCASDAGGYARCPSDGRCPS